METYEYTPPEKKEESKNLDKLDKLFGKEETSPPQPKIPPQPNTPPQPASPQTTGHAKTEPQEERSLTPGEIEERERKEHLKRTHGIRSGETIDREFRRIEQPEAPSQRKGFDMVSLILTVVIAAVTLMIGLVVVANIGDSLSSTVPEAAPAVQEAATEVATSAGTAFNFAALGLFIMAAVFIIGIMANVLGGSD